MTFNDLSGGNNRITEKLRDIIKSGKVSHAYIFEGDASTEKDILAKCFLKALLCKEHPGEGCEECINCMKIEHGNYEDLFFV